MSTHAFPIVVIENTGPAGANLPFTFGQVFIPGHMPATSGLYGVIDEKTTLQLQVDVKALHADGSVRHAVISGAVPKMEAGQKLFVSLMPRGGVWKSTVMSPMPAAPATLPTVKIKVGEVEYAAAAPAPSGPGNWLSGPVVQEWQYESPFVSASGTHPHLVARFGIRTYGRTTRMEVVVENNKAFAPGIANVAYEVLSPAMPTPLTHYYHARWRGVYWLGEKSALVVHPDTAYLMETRAVPQYDLSVKPSEKTLADWASKIVGRTGPMKIGPVVAAMGTTGGRPDIAPLPGWAVCYLLTHDKRAYDVMMAAADGAGSWPIHYRDENTGYPVQIDPIKNAKLSTHMNIKSTLARPAGGLGGTPYDPDTAHQPSLAFLPYLLTGEYFYLEELQFWTAWNPLGTDPANHGNGLGLLKWQQLRGQGWSLRTLGQAAWITPDAHPLKSSFLRQLENNIDFYHQTYVVGNPNPHGMYDGSGRGSFPLGGTPAGTGCAPFQDDFFTWALGYLVELGFDKARPVHEWKAQFAIKRMTARDFCWINGADFYYSVRKSAADPILPTLGAIQELTYGSVFKDDNRKVVTHPQGLRYIDQPCGSKEQADWIKAATGQGWWVPGRMLGYADSIEGYPANMQPNLATAVSLGVPGAAAAWAQYEKRAHKPDWTKGPQWNVIPRVAAVAPEVPVEPPVVTPPVVPPVTPPVFTQPNARCRMEAAIQAHSVAAAADVAERAKDAIASLAVVLDRERGIAQKGGQ